MSETNSMQRLVLCPIVGKGDRIFKRWCKPFTPILTPCCGCGFMHATYAKDAATDKCLDCFSCEAENQTDKGA